MENVIDYISTLGFIFFLVGVFNRTKPWGQNLRSSSPFVWHPPISTMK